jgi:hypothetical protein
MGVRCALQLAMSRAVATATGLPMGRQLLAFGMLAPPRVQVVCFGHCVVLSGCCTYEAPSPLLLLLLPNSVQVLRRHLRVHPDRRPGPARHHSVQPEARDRHGAAGESGWACLQAQMRRRQSQKKPCVHRAWVFMVYRLLQWLIAVSCLLFALCAGLCPVQRQHTLQHTLREDQCQ